MAKQNAKQEVSTTDEPMVKVKILKHVGKYTPGEVVEVSKSIAEFMCAPSVVTDGQITTTSRKAMLVEEYDQIQAAPKDLKNLTAKDMADMGIKNIVVTPQDAQFERQLQSAAKRGKDMDAQKAKVSSKLAQKDSEDAEWIDRKKAPLPSAEKST